MARPLRIQFPGAIYHITVRGNAYQNIFTDKYDYLKFLETLNEVKEFYGWEIFAYCLMPNHFHLLIKTPQPNLSLGMRDLNSNYTSRFNARHKRVGHLFQGRYKSIIVDENSYLHELIRYIALNPVKAKLVQNPKDWIWSSHRELLSTKKKDYIMDRQKVLSFFSGHKQLAKKEYLAYINEKQDNDIWSDLKGSLILGSDEFVIKIYEIVDEEKFESPEYLKKQLYLNRPKLEKIFGKSDSQSKRERNILKAKKLGYTNYEIGDFLKLHFTTVSKIYNREKTKNNKG